MIPPAHRSAHLSRLSCATQLAYVGSHRAHAARLQRSGFALLLTLLLLALAATVLAAIARRSYGQATEADRVARDLQQRWALSTLRPLLDEAPSALQPPHLEGRTTGPQPAARRLTTSLGHLHVELTFADEQAKLPIHSLTQRKGPEEAGRRLRSLLPPELASQVRLRPIDAFVVQLNDLPTGTPPFESFSQVLSALGPHDEVVIEQVQQLAQQVTLWGPGTLHFARTDPVILSTTLFPDLDLSQAHRLVDAGPNRLDEALKTLALSDRARQRVRSRQTNESERYSLWITLRDDHRRTDVMIVSPPDSLPEGTPEVSPGTHNTAGRGAGAELGGGRG